MSWVRLDDQFADHPKIVEAGPLAGWLFVCGLTYCARQLTDGFIPAGQLRKLADVDNAAEIADRLVASGLWEHGEGGYIVHDYLDYQPSAESVQAERTMNRRRKELYADPGLVHRVRKRDAERCRYCGVGVRWNDRKGAGGGTYDHIVPNGPNTDENIVIACRGCNSRKGQRTPEQANMDLLAPGTAMPSLKPDPSVKGSRSDLGPIKPKSTNPSRTHPIPIKSSGVPPEEATSEKNQNANGPWSMLETLCEELQQDATALSKPSRDKQLAAAKRLIDSGFSEKDLRAMVRWLAPQSWVSSGVDLFLIEKQRSKWELAGKPSRPPSPPSLNAVTLPTSLHEDPATVAKRVAVLEQTMAHLERINAPDRQRRNVRRELDAARSALEVSA